MLKQSLIVGLISLFLFVPMASAESPRFSIDFAGGTLVELMNEIIEDDGFVPNVIISDDARNVEIPPIHFEDVALGDFMRALNFLNLPLRLKSVSEDVWSASCDFGSGDVQIHSIQHLLDLNNPVHFKVDDIATAIQTSWNMYPSASVPSMKVHLETGLLMVNGNDVQLHIVSQLIKELSNQQERINYANEYRKQKNEISHLKNRYEEHKKMIEKLQFKNDQLKFMLGNSKVPTDG